MSMSRYVAAIHRDSITILQTSNHTQEGCRHADQYKAVKSPTCRCRPCLDKYLDARRAKDDQIAVQPEGWHPWDRPILTDTAQ